MKTSQKTRHCTWLLACLLLGMAAQAQAPADKCATMPMDSLLRRKFPQLGTLMQFEAAVQQKMKEIETRRRAGRVTESTVTIPIVVHVVHSGEPMGQGRNISAAQVQSQLDVLNEDFRRKPGTRGFNEDARGADIEIEFCLATLDPQGRTMPERGIDRIRGSRASYTRDQTEGEIKPSTSWDPNRYYNVWVLDFDGRDENLVGYAQFPSQANLPGIPESGGAASTDGVVVRYTSFGCSEKGTFPGLQAPYNLGRTLSHETGHWLGLRHIWGDGNCADDFVGDTPTQQSESRGCQKGRVSCGGANMVENYMDYSDDACMSIFTRGQKTRMRAVMELSPRRRELTASNVCGTLVAAKPVPNFRADKQQILRGAKVNFNDLSANAPTQWQWTFEGGSPATSTERNPVVTYAASGKYQVTLVATNGLGASDPLARTNYIDVLDAGLCGTTTNFTGTPTLLRQPAPGSGYIAGQNSQRDRAKAEYFNNSLGYVNLSGTSIKFGRAVAAAGATTESTVTVLVWNARGFQSSPGAVLERKEISMRTVLQDVALNRPTQIVFDRNAPINGLPFFVGIELNNTNRDTVAITTNQNGESMQITAWEQTADRAWNPYSISRGLNVAHQITPLVGMNESVQLSASSIFIDAGETVTLDARGASLFSWTPADNLSAVLGPQVVARPTRTTTYIVTGSGQDLCNTNASVTVFVRTSPTATEPTATEKALVISPNPTDGELQVSLTNKMRGKVMVRVYDSAGRKIVSFENMKPADTYARTVDMSGLAAGLYIVEFELDGQKVRRKVVKL